MRDFFAGITDVIGGRSSVYERRISRAPRCLERVGRKSNCLRGQMLLLAWRLITQQ